MNDVLSVWEQIFQRMLPNEVACIKTNEKGNIQIKQENSQFEAMPFYVDFKEVSFLKPSTIKNNQYLITKLKLYKEKLFSIIKNKKGFRVEVYDTFGNMVFVCQIVFFETNWLQRFFLKRMYEQLTI